MRSRVIICAIRIGAQEPSRHCLLYATKLLETEKLLETDSTYTNENDVMNMRCVG